MERLRLTSKILYNQIDQLYSEYRNNSTSYPDLIIIKSQNSYNIQITIKQQKLICYLTIVTGITQNGYETKLKKSYMEDNKLKSECVPVKFNNNQVIPQIELQELIQHFRHNTINQILK